MNVSIFWGYVVERMCAQTKPRLNIIFSPEKF